MASVSWHEGNEQAPTVTLNVTQKSQDISQNKSIASYSLKINRPSYVGSSASKAFSIIINGQSINGTTTIGGSGYKLITSGDVEVLHNSDGTKSIDFSFSLDIGVNWHGIKLDTATGGGTLWLDTIPRASTITSISGGTLGQLLRINYSAASDSFSHKVLYRTDPTYWGYFYDISQDATYSSGSGWAEFTPGISDANYIPGVTGTGRIRLETYSGSALIGTDEKKITLYVPDSVAPTIDSVTVTPDNSANATIEDWGIFVAGYSKAKIEASAEGSYGSTISSFSIMGDTCYGDSDGDKTYVSYTSSTFKESGNFGILVDAYDSRGRSCKEGSGTSVYIYPYSKPTISALNVQRSSGNAQEVVVRANWNFNPVGKKFGKPTRYYNSATATLQYKLPTDSGWQTYGIIDNDYNNKEITLTEKFLEYRSYNFRLIVTDAVGNSAQAESFISTSGVLLDFKASGKGLGIGKIAETDSMEVALDARFMGTIYIYDDSGNAMTLVEYIKSVVGSQ